LQRIEALTAGDQHDDETGHDAAGEPQDRPAREQAAANGAGVDDRVVVAPVARTGVTMTDPQPGEWMTLAEIAARFGVVAATVRGWVRRGLLPAERWRPPPPGRQPRIRVRAVDVEAFEHWYYRRGPRPPWIDDPEP